MLMEKPQCNLRYCRYHADGNCLNASKYENCILTDLHYKIEELTVDLDNAKANTVREMQERFIAELRKDGRMNYYIRKVLEQILKEMLEGSR